MDTGEIALLGTDGVRTQIASIPITPSSHLHISADTPQLALAAAFALFGFAVDQVVHLGYAIERIGSPLASLRIAYASPTPRSELSRFTETVAGEIAMGSPAPAEDFLQHLRIALRLETLQVRHPERLSGGETAKVILAAHLARLPNVLIFDRVLDELDRSSRASLHAFLRGATHPMVAVTTGSSCDGFPSDIELNLVEGRALLRFGSRDLEFEYDKEARSELTLEVDSLYSDARHYIVSVRGLTVRRVDRAILNDLSFTVNRGDLCWLVGPNGCGKSTLLEALCGLLPVEGTTQFQVARRGEENCDSRLAQVIAYSPQDPEGDVTELTLLDEVRLAQQVAARPESPESAAEAWLDGLGVPLHRRGLPLSDDIQNRKLASVLSAFARNRPLVLLDEPTLFLDTNCRDVVSAAMLDHLKQGGGVICATHDSRFREMLIRASRATGTET